MLGTADFHDHIADARLPQAGGIVDDAAALDTAVDMLDAHAPTGDAPIRGLLACVSFRPRGLRVGLMISTWSSVNARKPRSWSNRLPAGKGYGEASAMRLSWVLPA
jgi:hypothetical protein